MPRRPPYISVKEDIPEYFRDHGTVLDAELDTKTIDQIYENYQQLRTLQFPGYGTAYNSYRGEMSTWLSLFGKNALDEFPGMGPGEYTNWPIPRPTAIVRRQAVKREVVQCPACGTKFHVAPKTPRRPQSPLSSPILGSAADQLPLQQLDSSILVGSLTKLTAAVSSISKRMANIQLLHQISDTQPAQNAFEAESSYVDDPMELD
jgi:hypothetical protein